MTRKIHFLEVQPHYLLVGHKKGFRTKEDFWRFAASCGFSGITVAVRPDIVNVSQLATSSTYRDEWQNGFRSQGLDDGCSRLEAHVTMQCVCLDPSRKLKFGHFVTPDFREVSHRYIEKAAAAQTRAVIDASAALGHRYVVGFCGGRGYAKAQAKWAAYAQYWKLWVFALLAAKWNPLLEYAANHNVRLAFEIGHPENDLLTGANVNLFWSMLTPKARRGMAVNLDGSHFVNVGKNPVPHGKAIVEGTTDSDNPHGLHFVDHRKWGVDFDLFDGTASSYGGFEDWGKSSTTFATYGIIGPDTAVRQHDQFLTERYAAQGEPDMPPVYEGECLFLKDPHVGMEIGCDNIRVLREGGALTILHDAVPPAQIQTGAPVRNGTPHLKGPKGRIEIDNGDWPNFDAFASIPVKSWQLLELAQDEIIACQAILERIGEPEAAKAI